MTVPTTNNRVSYAGDGTTTVFAYPFKIFADGDLTVVLRDADGNETTKTLGADYTVSGAGSDSGGNVTMTTAPASGETLVIYRDLEIVQNTDYVEGDPFPASAHENALDKLTMICQQLDAAISRAVVGRVSTNWDSIDTQLPDPVAGLAIGWNDAANALMNLTSLGGIPVSTFGRSLVDDADAAEARTTLGVYSKAETDSAIDQVSDGLLTTGVDYLSSTQVRVQIGKVEILGDVYEVPSVIDLTPTLTASTWHYVFVEAPASGTTITSSQVSVSTTAPTEDRAKGGWYDAGGTKRCIGQFKADSTPAILPFRISGGRWAYGDAQYAVSTSSPPATLTAVSLGLPAYGRLSVTLRGSVSLTGTDADLLIANGHATGSAGNPPYRFAEVYSSTETGAIAIAGMGEVMTDASGQVLYAAPNGGTVKIMVDSFELPAGLRRTN